MCPRCETLAEHVLRHEEYTARTSHLHEARVVSLAHAIQDAIDRWVEANTATP